MLLVAIGATANIYYISNKWMRSYKITEDPEFNLIPEGIEDSPISNSLLYAWRLGLGDWDTDPFEGETSTSVWIIFVASTFICNLTFLNMLIAIMGDTFDKVMDTKL